MTDELSLSHTSNIAVAREIDGIEMGVLSDGRSYLTARGLALLCGVAPSSIIGQGKRWLEGDRNGKLAQMLIERGITRSKLYIELARDNVYVHAYTDDVSTLILEYYAFEANPPNKQAQTNFRKLAQAGLRAFVYQALGYVPQPQRQLSASWENIHERLRMHTVPRGYFSVFREGADFVLASIRAGLEVDDQTIPDISVGLTWANHWRRENLSSLFGEAIKHDHNFPEWYRQATSNPQEINVYPVAALGAFRVWLEDVYLPQKYPTYLKGKVQKGLIAASTVEMLLAEVSPPALPEAG